MATDEEVMERIRLWMQWLLSDLRVMQQRINEGRPMRGDWLVVYYFGQPYPRFEERAVHPAPPVPLLWPEDIEPEEMEEESEEERGPLILENNN